MKKEINIVAPEGYEIDRENSTFECIKFKPIGKKRWRDDTDAQFKGYYIWNGIVKYCRAQWNTSSAYDVFATEKQAKSALAMARISQIMANDERFGGVVTDEEWENEHTIKFIILRRLNRISFIRLHKDYEFLAFHTPQQRDLFLQENEDLVRDYLMID
ncbi:MAG: hypothetical protein J6W64_04760 [Bacilli bacterium]|nr:hypothetical protein [Bacilli bacterium]